VTALAQTGSARARKILRDGRLISGLNLDSADNMALKADGSAMEMMGRFSDIAPVLTLQALAEVGRRRVATLRADAVHDEAGFGALFFLDVGLDFVGEVAVNEGKWAAVGGGIRR